MQDFIERDLKYIWHPYTQMKDCKVQPPVLIEKAKGVKLYDDKGNMYYDTISSWWRNVHGHNHPKIKNAIKIILLETPFNLYSPKKTHYSVKCPSEK